MQGMNIKQLTLLLTCNTASMGDKEAEGLYRGHLKEKRDLEYMVLADDNIKMYLKETGWEGVDWINRGQDTSKKKEITFQDP
jgi:hypothetical protein